MVIPCADYYEQYLLDNCNNDCEKCFADKDVAICKRDFYVTGDTILNNVEVANGTIFRVLFLGDEHVRLEAVDGKRLIVSRRRFSENFDY